MRLAILVALTMVAFAANSLLTRLALANGSYDAIHFGAVRLFSGAGLLLFLVGLRQLRVESRAFRPKFSKPDFVATAALSLYIFAFSWAYLSLDTGLGALILFGIVQLTMFGGALLGGEQFSRSRWTGAAMAFSGLIWLLWPNQEVVLSLPHAVVMASAGFGWGVYSLVGRGAQDPLADTARNFLWATPIGCLAAFMLADTDSFVQNTGLGLAILSGAVTSGLGYALWYRVLLQLSGTAAALAQLSVPVIAMGGGMLLLSEPLTLRFLFASILILGGIAFGLRR